MDIVWCRKNNDMLALGLGMYLGAGKYIWYNGCFINDFSASCFVEPDALDNFKSRFYLSNIHHQSGKFD